MKKLPWYEPMKRKLVVNQPGEGAQVDVKYAYNKSGRRYQFSVFDPYTSLYHFTVFDTKESKNSVLALGYAKEYFGFEILSVQTDNGSEFRRDFHQYLTKNQVPHFFIPKKSPWWNAQVERVHRTIPEPLPYLENSSGVVRILQQRESTFSIRRVNTKKVLRKCYPLMLTLQVTEKSPFLKENVLWF